MSASPAILTYAPSQERIINPWIVALVVVVPTFMEVLDTTVANVALRYIAGGLSAAVTDSEWVITSYLAANAIILPISGYLAARFGRRNYFLLSIALFTLSSALCGAATNLGQLILFRVLQGLAGGGLQPSSQAILLDAFPPEKQGAAMTIFGFAALLAPVVGPTLGGYLTDNYSWRWIFYINIPVGLIAVIAAWMFVQDPPYLRAQHAESKRNPKRFDTLGLTLLTTCMISWEVFLSKGEQWDWFDDPFWRVQTLAIIFVSTLIAFVIRERRTANPIVNLKTLRDRNFRISCIIAFCAFATLYGVTVSLPALLQSLLGYDATSSGLVMSPAGISSIMMMVVVGAILGRGVDARWLIAIGLFTLGLGGLWYSRLNLEISFSQVIWPRVVQITGLSMIFAPLSVAAYKYLPLELRGAAVGMFSLLRNEGGSVGTSMAQTFQERREQFHLLRLNEFQDPFNPATRTFLARAKDFYLQHSGDPVNSARIALSALDEARHRQAASLAYFDVFWIFAIIAFALILTVPLMRRSVAEKGAHHSAE